MTTYAISTRGVVFMTLLAIQFGFQSIATKMFVDENADKILLVLSCEVLKIFIAAFLLVTEGGDSGRRALRSWSLSESLICGAFPAAIYACQNVCIQMGYQHLSGTMFNVLNQTKIVFTAVMVYFLADRRQSPKQCISLAIVGVIGVALSMDREEDATRSSHSRSRSEILWNGILPTLAASVLSGFASGWSQRVMTAKESRRNAYLFSAELSFYSALFLVGNIATASGIQGVWERTAQLFHTQKYCWIPIFTNALGGIFVGQVIKHAGGVSKSFSIIAGIMVTCVAEYLILGYRLSSTLRMSIPFALLSMYVYATNPPTMGIKETSKKER